jgi:PHP family Zn ribbon phosphoesterase
MKVATDLQIHSKYARATSPRMVIDVLAEWAKIKGLQVIGTGDFTHPDWFRELKDKLVPAESGLFFYKNDPNIKDGTATRFMLTCETSHIYTKNNKGRRVHMLFWTPSFAAAEKINAQLGWRGNLRSDGRPILGIDAKDLVKIVLDADSSSLVIPAHIWTPWFSVFGSMSGFDTLQECFDELTPHIKAVETGLSSDPAMNWRQSQLDKVALVSNSDAHSPEHIGRECNVFELESLNYKNIADAVISASPEKLKELSLCASSPQTSASVGVKSAFSHTIEFYPEEGRYHFDGHRACKVRFSPKQTREAKGVCPECKKSLTIGVLYRVEQLADRPQGYKPEFFVPYKSLIPLDELIAETLSVQSKTKKVEEIYVELCKQFHGEIAVLSGTPIGNIASAGYATLAEGIQRMRDGKVSVEPGYDGEYGKIKVFNDGETKDFQSQKALF